MGDGNFTPNNLLDVLSNDAMNQLFYDGFWLETTDDPTVLESSFSFPTSETNLDSLSKQNTHREIILEEAEKSSNYGNPSLVYNTQMEEFSGNQEQKDEIILPSAASTQFGSFQIEGTEMNRRLWVGPNRNQAPTTSVKSKLVQAIKYLKESTNIDKDVLIQIWVPRKRGGRHILTTDNQLFSLSSNSTSLAEYRRVSRDYHFAAEENSNELVGLPGRVFLNKLPEWTPDVRFFSRDEYSRVNHAQQYNVRGSLALPVFQRGCGTCLGVVEIVTTTRRVNYRPELEDICKALEAVDLRSSNVSSHPKVEECSKSYQAALAEIQNVLKCVCDAYKLPLAQTWAPCTQQGKTGCRHSDENYSSCVSIVDSACYVLDPQVQSFHEVCSEHHLLKGEGVAGGAFWTNKPCSAMDIKAFSKTEYPLSHQARMFGMCAAIAIRLRSIYTESDDFVLEFFLPLDCKDAENQKEMFNSLSSVIQHICHGLRVVTDQELAEEAASLGGQKGITSSVGTLDAYKSSSVLTSSPNDPSTDASSWFTHMMKAQEKGKGVVVPLDSHSVEPEEEFKVTTMQRNSEMGLLNLATFPDHIQIRQDSGSKDKAQGSGELSSLGEQYPLTAKRAGEKRRTKAEKTISLQVLRQHFSGSLKDAAKHIGVCPTTLKRICRTYGIQRWPSRKIKKVGHSLRKVQLVIDSIQGAEGAIQLSSFYNKFPELSSPNMAGTSNNSMLKTTDPVQQSNMLPEVNLLSPGTTATISPSSSCSHSSGSSFSCPTGAKQSTMPVNTGDALLAEQSKGMLKRARSDAELPLVGQDESNLLLVRSHSQKIFTEHASLEALPPLTKPDIGIFKVKASFREENIRFSLQLHWCFGDLQRELLRRFNIDNGGQIDIKYLDDDSEWVLLTCDDDLEECIDIHRSIRSRTIKLSLNQGYPSNRGRLFGSSWPS